MTTKTETTAKTRKTAAIAKARQMRKPISKKEQDKRVKAVQKRAEAAKKAAAPITSLDQVKAPGSRRSVEKVIQAEQAKLVKGAKQVITSYCAIGEQLKAAKAAIEGNGQSWAKFMEDKPLGLAYSTGQRYIAAYDHGAAKMIEAFEAQGSEALNFKNLLSDVTAQEREKAGKGQHGMRGKKLTKSASAAAQPASEGGDDIGQGPLTDQRLDTILELDVPRMTEAQAERLALALRAHLEELHEESRVIEGEAA